MKLVYNYIFYPMQGKEEDAQMIADGNAGMTRGRWSSACWAARP